MFDYQSLQLAANDVLAQFGQDCTVTVTGRREYDPETESVRTQTVTHRGKCVFGRLTEKHMAMLGGAALVQAGDVMLMATASCWLQNDAVLECNGERWQLVNTMPVKPAAVVLAYQAQARRL